MLIFSSFMVAVAMVQNITDTKIQKNVEHNETVVLKNGSLHHSLQDPKSPNTGTQHIKYMHTLCSTICILEYHLLPGM